MDNIKIRDANKISRLVAAGKGSRIFATTSFTGKAISPLPKQVSYEWETKYPNLVRLD